MKTTKKPVLGIYFSDKNPMGPPLDKTSFLEAYMTIIQYLSERGVKTVILRGDTYMGKRVFKRYYHYSPQKKRFERSEKTIAVDLIWNRDSENTLKDITDCPMYNDFELDQISRDKFAAYQALKEISAKTYVANSYQEVKEYVSSEYPNDLFVLKPRYGERSVGVYCIKADELKADLYSDWENILIQEYLDSREGIEGISEGAHEIKIWLVDGVFVAGRISILAPDSFILNAEAANKPIEKKQLSYLELEPELQDRIKDLQQFLSQYPISLLRADFVKTKKGYKLIEMNSRPSVANTIHDGTDFYWQLNIKIADSIVGYFEKKLSTQSTLPLIVGAPHATLHVPRSVKNRLALTSYQVWRMGDPFTSYTSVHPYSIATIHGKVNRILCDVSFGEHNNKIRDKDFYGNKIFKSGKEFTAKERTQFRKDFAGGYRQRIINAFRRAHELGFKEVLFVDHHNTASEHPVNKSGAYMPSLIVSNGGKRFSGAKSAQNDEKLSCPAEFLHTFKDAFDTRMNFRAEINYIYTMSHTIRWIMKDVAPQFNGMKIYCIFLEYDLNLIHNPITKRNDHLAKAMLRDAINTSLEAVIARHMSSV